MIVLYKFKIVCFLIFYKRYFLLIHRRREIELENINSYFYKRKGIIGKGGVPSANRDFHDPNIRESIAVAEILVHDKRHEYAQEASSVFTCNKA